MRQEGLLQILAQLLEKPEYLESSSQKIAIWCLVNILRGGVSDLSSQVCLFFVGKMLLVHIHII